MNQNKCIFKRQLILKEMMYYLNLTHSYILFMMKYATCRLCNNTLNLNFMLHISHYIEILCNYMILHINIKVIVLSN